MLRVVLLPLLSMMLVRCVVDGVGRGDVSVITAVVVTYNVGAVICVHGIHCVCYIVHVVVSCYVGYVVSRVVICYFSFVVVDVVVGVGVVNDSTIDVVVDGTVVYDSTGVLCFVVVVDVVVVAIVICCCGWDIADVVDTVTVHTSIVVDFISLVLLLLSMVFALFFIYALLVVSVSSL